MRAETLLGEIIGVLRNTVLPQCFGFCLRPQHDEPQMHVEPFLG